MKYLLGTKVHMTQYFTEDGKAIPATVITASANTVSQVKTVATDGYSAVQVAVGGQKPERLSKAELGHTKELGAFKHVKEFRVDDTDIARGAAINVDTFAKGDVVHVTSTSKSKGFQGVVKRHGFHGGPRSHGQKHSEREPGSIGGGLRTRVPKGMRMAGRTGGDTVTVRNLTVLAVEPETNTLVVSGAIPGRRGTLVKIVSNS